jgi:hypothetical protein
LAVSAAGGVRDGVLGEFSSLGQAPDAYLSVFP